MTITELTAYFRNMSAMHTAIRHTDEQPRFFADIEDVLSKKGSSALSPIVVMGPPEFEPVDKHIDNQQERAACSLFILDYVHARGGNMASQLTAYDRCKDIAHDFASRMLEDERNQNTDVAYVNIENFRIEPVGPMIENYYGVQFDVEIDSSIDLSYNTSKWID